MSNNESTSTHISAQFSADLDEVRNHLLAMGGLVEQQVKDAVNALVNADSALFVMLDMFSSAAFIILPILIGFTAAREFGGNLSQALAPMARIAGYDLEVIDPRTAQASYDQAVASKRQNEALLATARSNYQRSNAPEYRQFVAKTDLDTQRNQVAQYESAVAANEASMRSAQVQLQYTRVTAPITGVAGIRAVDAGNVVSAGGRVLCVTALGDSAKLAQQRAYDYMRGIQFDGMQFRTDIGWRAIKAR